MVAGCWVILGLATPISGEPVLWGLARLTCPIVPVSLAFHFGVKWYWVLVANVPTYALNGLMVEVCGNLESGVTQVPLTSGCRGQVAVCARYPPKMRDATGTLRCRICSVTFRSN